MCWVPGKFFHRTLVVVTLLLLATTVQAHFVYIVPAKDGTKAQVVLSENLEPDEDVAMDKIAQIKLMMRDASGKDVAIEHKTEKHCLLVNLPGTGSKLVYGTLAYGVMQKGDTKPFLLTYHPKTVIATTSEKAAMIGDKAALEIIPVIKSGTVQFRVLSAGKPVSDAEFSISVPGGKKEKGQTNKEGLTPVFTAQGQFGMFAKYIEAKSGEFDGKKYEEIRHYATLVVEVSK